MLSPTYFLYWSHLGVLRWKQQRFLLQIICMFCYNVIQWTIPFDLQRKLEMDPSGQCAQLHPSIRKYITIGQLSLKTEIFSHYLNPKILTFYSLTSICIFSALLPIHILRCWQGEFVQPSRASIVGDHLLYSHKLNLSFRGDVIRRIRY